MQSIPARSSRFLLLGATALAAACGGSNYNPARYGTVSVVVEGPVSDTQRTWFATALDPLGPDFQVSTAGVPTVRVIADTTLGTPGSCAMRVSYTEHIVRLSHPACFTSETAGRAAIAHALGHALLMTHICRSPTEASDCSPVGTGGAIMNGGMQVTQPDGTLTETFTPGNMDSPSGLDMDEFRRVHP
jgi:hypothetical protein